MMSVLFLILFFWLVIAEYMQYFEIVNTRKFIERDKERFYNLLKEGRK